MSSHAILISVKYRKAFNSEIPMSLIENFRKAPGFPVPIDRDEIRRYFEAFAPDAAHTIFMDFFEDFIIESSREGTLSAYDVAFDPKRERGYFFHLDAW
jgi:hypothetical protein